MNKTPHVFRYVRPLLAMLIVLLSFGFLYLIALKPIPDANASPVNTAQGFLLAALGVVVSYYFGTSKDKSDGEQQQRQPNTETTVVTKTEEIK